MVVQAESLLLAALVGLKSFMMFAVLHGSGGSVVRWFWVIYIA
jgi:hypothetical protein